MNRHSAVRPMLGIVVPVLNDAAALTALIPQLRALQERGAHWIVVDGGSHEKEQLHCQVLTQEAGGGWLSAPRGRAQQMNAGAQALLANTAATALWFVHADSGLPLDADLLIHNALACHCWGRFDVRIQGQSRCLPMVARMMNWRSRVTHIATGDQGFFMRSDVFEVLDGFAPIALMEDIEMSRRLKRLGPPACLRERLITSGRRWDECGALRTIMLMWALRWRYWWGASPEALQRRYYRSQAAEVAQPHGPATPRSS
jgi:rSAM/selenodomain-associated transferase 2